MRARDDAAREACTHYQRARALLRCRQDGHDQTNEALEYEASLELSAAVDARPDWQSVHALFGLLEVDRPVDALALVDRALADGGADLGEHRAELEGWRADLDGRLGTIVVHSDSPGATLTVDDRAAEIGELVRVTPREAHHLRIAAAGYWAETREAAVAAGHTTEISVRLVRNGERAWLDLETDPSGAEVSIDEELRGVAPLRGVALSSGGHRLRAALPRYDTVEREIVLANGETQEVTLSLSLHREIYEEWWFWTLVVLAVGGAATTVGVLYDVRGIAPHGTIADDVLP